MGRSKANRKLKGGQLRKTWRVKGKTERSSFILTYCWIVIDCMKNVAIDFLKPVKDPVIRFFIFLGTQVKKVLSIVGCVMYVLDVNSDLYTAYRLFLLGPAFTRDAYFSLTFTAIPIIITAIAEISSVIQDTKRSLPMKIMLVPIIICCAVFIPFYFMVKASFCILRGDGTDCPAANKAALMKLIEALLESLPQALLQMKILTSPTFMETWPWISFAFSLINLSLTVPMSNYLFEDLPISSKAAFFFGGLLAISSRIMVITMFVVMDYGLKYWIMAMVTIFVCSITMWILKRFCSCCSFCLPLGDVHYNWYKCHHVVITWTLTTFHNCFTLSGLFISFVTMAGAVSVVLINVVLPGSSVMRDINSMVYILILIFSPLTLIVNLLLVLVPKLRHSIGDNWLNIDEQGRTRLY